MADDLDVSGGTTAVSTEDLEVAVDQLRRLGGELGLLSKHLASVETPPRGGMYVQQARVDIELAAQRLDQAALRALQLHMYLAVAGRGYEYAERVVSTAAREVGTSAAQLAGRLLPGLALSAGFAVSMVGGLWFGLRASGGLGGVIGGQFEERGVPRGSPWARENNGLITNPATVSTIRTVSQSVGPFLLGSTGLPLGLTDALPGTFAFGANGLVALGRSQGLFQETPVRLVETIPQPVTSAPAAFVDRLDRVPYFEGESGPQVVVERYSVPGEADRFSVYVTGTVTFSPGPSNEPWDMTSNMINATGELSGSVASVQAAMAAAGVDADSPVQLTGYSQGGGVVACVAATGHYNLQGITTFGGPTGQVPLPEGVPAVIVEHTDDPVPALGGEQANAGAVLVRRDVFGGEEIPHDYAVPSHHLEYYLETARLMDVSASPQLDETIAKLNSFTEGAKLESSTAYRFERDT